MITTKTKTEKLENKSLYVPELATIQEITQPTPTEKQFVLKFDDPKKQKEFNFLPGQFLEVTVFGVGELLFRFHHPRTIKNILSFV